MMASTGPCGSLESRTRTAAGIAASLPAASAADVREMLSLALR
jgi:hypothetical protein